MSRLVMLDTETTGLNPEKGHRIIEIGCVEVIDRNITANNYHQYINPERTIDQSAIDVHGISNDFLQDKPYFHEIAQTFIEFIFEAELVIHNAPFDVGFINHEFARLANTKKVENLCKITDSLVYARHKHIGQKNSLDALCKRYDIDLSNRSLHGALLDAELLAKVYLRMTGGQRSMSFEMEKQSSEMTTTHQIVRKGKLPVIMADRLAIQEHNKILQMITKKTGCSAIWEKLKF